MDNTVDLFHAYFGPMFDCFPEPVIFLLQNRPVYTNGPGQAVLDNTEMQNDLLSAMAEHPGDSMQIALSTRIYRVTVSLCKGGQLLVLRPVAIHKKPPHPFTNSISRMRECLSGMNAILVRTRRALEAKGIFDEFQEDFFSQARFMYRILRMTRQAELTEDLNHRSFPKEEGFDLAQVCEGMCLETTMMADLSGVTFTYNSTVKTLPFKGSKSLLTHMLLALISNAVRAAGKGGHASMNLTVEEGRCTFTVSDSGLGIPEEQFNTIFNGEVPVPPPVGSGELMGLYNARRIAILHGGTMIAQSGQDGGTNLVVSLPISVPESVPIRNNPGYDNPGGFSPVFIELSDLLPWQAFSKAGTPPQP